MGKNVLLSSAHTKNVSQITRTVPRDSVHQWLMLLFWWTVVLGRKQDTAENEGTATLATMVEARMHCLN